LLSEFSGSFFEPKPIEPKPKEQQKLKIQESSTSSGVKQKPQLTQLSQSSASIRASGEELAKRLQELERASREGAPKLGKRCSTDCTAFIKFQAISIIVHIFQNSNWCIIMIGHEFIL